MTPGQYIRYPGSGPILQGADPGQIVTIPDSGGSGANGAIPQSVELVASTAAPVSPDPYAELLSQTITVLGASSGVLILFSFNGYKFDQGTVFFRFKFDGVVMGNGFSSAQRTDMYLSGLVPYVTSAAAGVHTVSVEWYVDAGTFTIDPTSGADPTPGPIRNARLTLLEVPS